MSDNSFLDTIFQDRSLEEIEVLKQLMDEWDQAAQTERSRLHDWEWEEEREYSILGDIQMLSDNVAGFASQIIRSGHLVQPLDQTLATLEKLRLFEYPYFSGWYFDPQHRYPLLKRYVDMTDHLRLLVIDYIRTYLLK